MQYSATIRALAAAISAARVEPPVIENCVRGAQFARTDATDSAVAACAAEIAASLPDERRTVRWVSNIIIARLRELSDLSWDQVQVDWEDGISQSVAAFDFHGGDYNYKLIAGAIEDNISSISAVGA